MAGDAEDRTEAASARRLQRAREQGDIPVSREVSLLAGLAGGGAMLVMQLSTSQGALLNWFAAALQQSGRPIGNPWRGAIAALVWGAGPSAVAAVLAVLATGALQTTFLMRLEALQPDLGRVSPGRGIKRLFSSETLVQALKSITKLVVLSIALWMALGRLLPTLPAAPAWPPDVLSRRLVAEATHLLLVLAGAQAAIALADLFWVRMHHAARHRMSRQEQRDEHKDTEGNPLVRQRLRQLARNRGGGDQSHALRGGAGL
jgi:flagellar biosynthetic protein FlhB